MDDSEDFFWRKPTEVINYSNFKILGYMSLACFAIGTVNFTLSVAVLTRKHMITPMNTIVIHYWSNLMIAALVYLPRLYHETFRVKVCAISEQKTYEWEMISHCSFLAAAAFRHNSVWLVLMIGVWRYIAVIYPLKERIYCNMEITKKVILFGYVLISFAVSIPLTLCTRVGPSIKLLDQNGCSTANYTIGKNTTIYEMKIPVEDYPVWYALGMISLGIPLKLAPSGIMAFVSYRLIAGILEAMKRRKRMVVISERQNTYNSKMERKISQKKDRTTILLLLMLGLFAFGELPLGIFATLSGFYGPHFFWKYWYQTVEVANAVTYISEVFNIPIYYAMSREFRETLKSLFTRNLNGKKIPNPRPADSFSSGYNGSKEDNTSRSSVSVAVIQIVHTG